MESWRDQTLGDQNEEDKIPKETDREPGRVGSTAFRKLRQKDQVFKASLSYITRPYLGLNRGRTVVEYERKQ